MKTDITYQEAQEEYRILRRCSPNKVEQFLEEVFDLEVVRKPNLCDTCVYKSTHTELGCWVERNEGHLGKNAITGCRFHRTEDD